MGLAGGLATNGEIGGGGGASSLEVTDGTTAVSGVTEIDITSGATVTNAGGGIAQVAISGGSGVSSVTAGDTSIVVGGTSSAPTLETGTLDVIATDHPPAANWSNNSKKITGLANGTAASDAAAFGQIPVVDGTASDIQPDGASAVAGAIGKWADAGHVHPASGLPKAGGLTGATAATRFVGATASGAPASGTFAVGDFVIDQSGKVWVCTAAGTPGTWANAGASAGVSSFNTRTGAVTPGNADYLAVATGGLTGATAAARFVGGTASGAPASGTFAVGDFAVAQNGAIWVCTSAGSPGTWVEIPPEAIAPSGPSGTAGANTGAAQTIGSPTTFNQWWGVMNAATVTLTLPAAIAGGLFQVRLDQDATGGRVLAFAANPVFPGYASATAALAKINAQSAIGAEIWITFVCVDGSTWQAFPALPQGRAVVSVTSGASITPALQGPQDHIFVVSALAAAMTVNAMTGSPVDGQKVEFRLAQNGTGGFAITWNAVFTTANTALITWPAEPTTASATWKELYEWNASTSKWERMAMV